MILPTIELQPGAQVAVPQGTFLQGTSLQSTGSQGASAAAGDVQPSFLAAFGESLRESAAGHPANALSAGLAGTAVANGKAAGEEAESVRAAEVPGSLVDGEAGTSVARAAAGSSNVRFNGEAKAVDGAVDEAGTDRAAGVAAGVKAAGASDLLKAERGYGSGLGEAVATKAAGLADAGKAGAANASGAASGTSLADLETAGLKGAKTAAAEGQTDPEIEAAAKSDQAGLSNSRNVAQMRAGDEAAQLPGAKQVAVKAASGVTSAKTGAKVQGGKGLAGALTGPLTAAGLSSKVGVANFGTAKSGVLGSGAAAGEAPAPATGNAAPQESAAPVPVQPGAIEQLVAVRAAADLVESALTGAGEIGNAGGLERNAASAAVSSSAEGTGASKTWKGSEFRTEGQAKPESKYESVGGAAIASTPVAAAGVPATAQGANLTTLASIVSTAGHALPSTAVPSLTSARAGAVAHSGAQPVSKTAALTVGGTGLARRGAVAAEDKTAIGGETTIESARQAAAGARERGALQPTKSQGHNGAAGADGPRTSQQGTRGEFSVPGNAAGNAAGTVPENVSGNVSGNKSGNVYGDDFGSATSMAASNTAVSSGSGALAAVSTGGAHSANAASLGPGNAGSAGVPAGAHSVATNPVAGMAGQELAGGVSGAKGVSSTVSGAGLPGGVAGASRTDVATIDEPHRTLLATPTTLEVGVPNGTEGWVRIRAQVGDQGQVNASLAAGSSAGQEMLHRELPALNAYLHGEQLPVTAAVAERSFTSAGGGVADEAGRAMSPNAGLTQGGTGHESTANQGATGGQQSDSGQRAISGSLDAGDAMRGYNGAGVSEAGSAQMSMDGESGRWLNVRA